MDNINRAQKERLSHIDFRLYFLGSIGRNDLVERFGIKEAAATRDISLYKELASQNLIYNTKKKVYEIADSFSPLFNYQPTKVLSALSLGFGDDTVNNHKAFISCEIPSQLNKPDIDTLSKLSRAIFMQRPLAIQYRSLSSGFTEREIVPFCLVDNGLRWHVRAYDRRREQFTDFVITRITNPTILLDSITEDHENITFDNQWNRIVELVIVAHPRLKYKETIEADYGMKKHALEVNVRAAVAGYLLRRWNVDCSADASLEGDEYHLWLKNKQALYGVKNLLLAPGFKDNFE